MANTAHTMPHHTTSPCYVTASDHTTSQITPHHTTPHRTTPHLHTRQRATPQQAKPHQTRRPPCHNTPRHATPCATMPPRPTVMMLVALRTSKHLEYMWQNPVHLLLSLLVCCWCVPRSRWWSPTPLDESPVKHVPVFADAMSPISRWSGL